jgi:hypothetical protein
MLISAWSLGCLFQRVGLERARPAPPILGRQIERTGRTLTGNALLGLLAPAEVGSQLKEDYNRASPERWPRFAGELARGLGLYDGFDGRRGNQWLASRSGVAEHRYRALAELLADDRIWVNSASPTCTRMFAVEFAVLANALAALDDCGGRTPNYDAVDIFRSLLVDGTRTNVGDGVARDDRTHSTTEFPFLAPP